MGQTTFCRRAAQGAVRLVCNSKHAGAGSRPTNNCPALPCWFAHLQSNQHRFAAWMEGVSQFDEGLFRLSRMEAVGLDPQCRVVLEQTAAAVMDATPALQVSTGQRGRCCVPASAS